MKQILIVFWICISLNAFSTNYYISNTGNDALDGKSPANAWKTIAKYNASKASIVAGDSVLLKRGDTFIGKIAHRSGIAGKPVVFSAYGLGAKPVITGSEPILNWVSKGNDVYTVTGSNLYTHLFVNKKQITIARFPNQLYTLITALSGNTATNSLINIAGVNWTGATFHYRRQNDQLQKGAVTSHSGTSLTIDANVNMTVNHGFYLDNHLAALDLPYEWFQDKTTKLITIKLPPGVQPSSLSIEGSFVDTGLDLNWAGKYVTAQNLEFRNFTGNAINGGDVSNIRIISCDFYWNNLSGIRLEGVNFLSADNEIDGNKFYDHNNVALGVNKCTNLKITNNTAKRIALIPGYEAPNLNDGMGMYLSAIKNSYIAYNLIDSTGYSDIVASGDNNLFERNILSNHGLSKNDNGFIQFWGGHTHNNTIKENICFNGFGNTDGLPEAPLDNFSGNGIYFDDYTHDNTITSNTVYNSGNGIFVQSSQNMTVRDNVTFDCQINGFSAHEKDQNGSFPESTQGWLRPVYGLALRKNIFYATNPTQNCIRYGSDECATDYDFGTSDSNYVFNPYSSTSFMKRFPACGKYPGFDFLTLKSWQTKYNQELNSKTNKVVYPQNTYTFAGSELLSNGNFDQNITGWGTWQAGVTATWDGATGINGGTVKLSNTTTGSGEMSGPKFNYVAGKKYLLKFTARTNSYEMVEVRIARNSPYASIDIKGFPVDKEGYNAEWYFTASGGDPISKIQFYINGGNTLWLDNVSLKEVTTAVPDNYSERSKLFVNKTTTEQTFSLAGLSYFDLDGNPVCGSIKVAPFRSKVLIRDYNNGCGVQNNCTATGTILREYWANIPGTSVSSIPITKAPTSSSQLTIFEGPSNVAEEYGSRIRGYICPPANGLYTFWIASDDNSELWLSTNDQPSGRVKIASVNDWTGVREWTKLPSQQSVPINLQAGTKYYIEALHKEGTGGDNLAVGWQLPDGTLERPIAGSRLSPYIVPANEYDTQAPAAPTLSTTGKTTTSVALSWTASTDNVGVTGYDVYNGSTLLGSTTSLTYTASGLSASTAYTFTVKAKDAAGNISAASNGVSVTTNAAPDTQAPTAPTLSSTGKTTNSVNLSWTASTDNVGVTGYDVYNGSTLLGSTTSFTYTASGLSASTTYTFTVKAKDAAGNVSPASNSLTVTTNAATNPCNATGTILREYWANIPGTSVSAIPVTTAPTSSSQLTIFEGPSNVADNYGSRIRGYICPPTTGLYTFWISSDDNSELWLSTTDLPENKVMIASVTGWTNIREWVKYGSQKSVPINLTQGQNYYIEALHKEGTSGENLAVGWDLPDGTQERPILGSRLSPYNDLITGNETDEKYSVEVYPNPTNGIFNVKLNEKFSGHLNISLNNMMGVEVKSFKISNSDSKLDLSLDIAAFPAGTYYLKVHAGSTNIVKKIVKF